uniref:Magnesium transporter n=1 Tax=Strongyloides venezuelensis TaxID=75913 RepID=A0A0K0FSH6_STRVS
MGMKYGYPIISGLCGCLASISMSKIGDCKNYHSKVVLILCFIALNIAMWYFLQKSFKSLPTTIIVILVSSSTNFIATGIIDNFVNNKPAKNCMWWFGVLLTIIGIAIIGKEKNNYNETIKKEEDMKVKEKKME